MGGGGGDTDSLRSNSWDGRGAEPERRAKPLNTRRKHRHTLSPWDDYVDEDEVEGGEPGDGLYRTESRRFDPPSRTSTSSRLTEPVADPLTNEQFYPQPVAAPLRATPTGGKKKFGSALLKNRSRYEQPFDTTDAASSRTRGSDGFQDDFEREINGGAQQSAAYSSSRAGGSAGRFDTFEAEGPEDAWGSARPANGSSRAPLRPQKTGRAEETDGDRECFHALPFLAPLLDSSVSSGAQSSSTLSRRAPAEVLSFAPVSTCPFCSASSPRPTRSDVCRTPSLRLNSVFFAVL